MTRSNLDVHVKADTAGASSALLLVARGLAEPHRPTSRPTSRPYPGAPGFVLTECRVCDGGRARVQQVGDVPVSCEVWRDAVSAGVVEPGSR